MLSVDAIIERLAGPLRAEGRRGYSDTTITGTGGISQYARAWAEQAQAAPVTESQRRLCTRIGNLLAGYSQAEAGARQKLAQQAERLLGQLANAEAVPEPPPPPPAAAAAPKKAPARKRAARPAAEAAPTSVLEEPVGSGARRRPAWAQRLAKIGIETNRDLLYHFPRSYVPVKKISDLVDGERAGVVVSAGRREESVLRSGGSFQLVKASLDVSDRSGEAWVTSIVRVPRFGNRAVAVRESPLMLNHPAGTKLMMEGTVRRAGRFIEIQYSEGERLGEGDEMTPGMLAPIYPLTDGLYQGQVRAATRQVLTRLPEDLPDPLPASLRERYSLLPLVEALNEIHWPWNERAMEEARRRLTFEEMLTLQLALAQRKRETQRPGSGISMKPRGDVVAALEEILPFQLTRAQQRVIAEITADMATDLPMCRLVQGDVGSGKTVVAAAGLLIALQNGYQGSLMAPTELLAEQHFLVLSRMLEPLGVRVELLTGSLRATERERAYRHIADGRAQVVVGTHALIQSEVQFHRLGLVIVDEQHRFGVRQRAELRTKGVQPDMLVMTATPIPRTLALTVYGDLEVSILDEMPPGRTPVKTEWLPTQQQEEAYQFVRQQVAEGRQAYVVCPLIEESESLQAEAATKLAEDLQHGAFADLRVALLHGSMKVMEKDEVMEAFRRGEVDVLVCTTVVEVGVDVPNATVMLILSAERFGLAQLHQLRGRVGRGEHASTCLLLTQRKYDPGGRLITVEEESLAQAKRRMKVLTEQSDGFAIAEEDLLLRGPGEFYGTRQHGLPDFRLARMATDVKVLEEAREAAFWLTERDPELAEPEHEALRERVAAVRARMEEVAG
jgi:ATP-dependent DNA helicase RecG